MYDSFDKINVFIKFNQGEITMGATYKIKALIKEIESESETSTLNIKISGKSGKYAIEDTEDYSKKIYNLFWSEDKTKSDVSIITKSADSFLSIKSGLDDIQKQIILACYSNNKLIELTINEKYIIENVKGL